MDLARIPGDARFEGPDLIRIGELPRFIGVLRRRSRSSKKGPGLVAYPRPFGSSSSIEGRGCAPTPAASRWSPTQTVSASASISLEFELGRVGLTETELARPAGRSRLQASDEQGGPRGRAEETKGFMKVVTDTETENIRDPGRQRRRSDPRDPRHQERRRSLSDTAMGVPIHPTVPNRTRHLQMHSSCCLASALGITEGFADVGPEARASSLIRQARACLFAARPLMIFSG